PLGDATRGLREEVRGRLDRGRFDEVTGPPVGAQQELDLPPQVRVARADAVEKGGAFAGRAVECRLEQRVDPPPSLRRHTARRWRGEARPSPRATRVRPFAA